MEGHLFQINFQIAYGKTTLANLAVSWRAELLVARASHAVPFCFRVSSPMCSQASCKFHKAKSSETSSEPTKSDSETRAGQATKIWHGSFCSTSYQIKSTSVTIETRRKIVTAEPLAFIWEKVASRPRCPCFAFPRERRQPQTRVVGMAFNRHGMHSLPLVLAKVSNRKTS